MSYTVHLNATKCESCGCMRPYPDSLPDPTYNLTPIFHFLLTGEKLEEPSELGDFLSGSPCKLTGLRVLNGKKALDTIEVFGTALWRAAHPDNKALLLSLNPPNGWGDLEGAVECILKYMKAAMEYPHNFWDIR